MRALWLGLCLASLDLANETVPRHTPESLQSLLQSEADGLAVDRRASLSNSGDLSDAARWQVGQFKQAEQWLAYELLEDSRDIPRLRLYRERRASIQKDVEGHRSLAHWCKTHQLETQALAHWYAVLNLSPNDSEARLQLNHRWIGGQWFTPEERQRASETSRRLQTDWAKWIPQLRRVANELTSSSPERTKRALETLKLVDDPSAISLLEIICHQLPDNHAIPFIQAIGRIQSQEAYLACCRIALARSDQPSDELAIKQIKSYQREVYIPELLSYLREPARTEVEYQFNPKGELLIQRAVFGESMDEKHALRLQRLVHVNSAV